MVERHDDRRRRCASRPARCTREHPGLVVAAVSPFGLDGPWRDRPTTDFTRQAFCGGHVQRGTPDRPPLLCGGRPGDWAAGTYAAIGALAALRRARAQGVGDLVDVAALDALMFSQPLFPVTWYEIAGVPFRPVRSSQLPNLHPTADGYVALQTTTGQQWLDFCTMIGRDDWHADERLARGTYRTLHRPELEPLIDEWTSARTTAEIVELATLLRIPVAEVGNGATLPQFAHLVDGGWFAENPAGFVQPSVPYRLGGGASPRPFARRADRRARHRTPPRPAGDRRHGPTRRRGRRVGRAGPCRSRGSAIVDLTAFWAGPIIGYACAVLGAEVIHVESTKRPDGIRLNGTRPMTEPQWWEWCPMFQGAEHQQARRRRRARHRTRARAAPRARRAQRRADRQLQPPCARAARTSTRTCCSRATRELVVLRAPAYGLTGPWRERLAYAPTIEAQAGIAWVSGFPDRGPEPPSGVADAMGGAHATVALLLALEYRRPHRPGHVPRVPDGRLGAEPRRRAGGRVLGVRTAARTAGQPQRDVRARRACTSPPTSTPTARATAGSRSRSPTTRQWVALCDAIDAPGWSGDPALATVEGRRGWRTTLDAALAAWCATRTTAEIVDRLSGAGVPDRAGGPRARAPPARSRWCGAACSSRSSTR